LRQEHVLERQHRCSPPQTQGHFYHVLLGPTRALVSQVVTCKDGLWSWVKSRNMRTLRDKTITLCFGCCFSTSTMAKPSLPVPPAIATVTMVGFCLTRDPRDETSFDITPGRQENDVRTVSEVYITGADLGAILYMTQGHPSGS
jgi:hypothetical protein